MSPVTYPAILKGVNRQFDAWWDGKHYGPGEHPSGSPQEVHGGEGDGGSDRGKSGGLSPATRNVLKTMPHERKDGLKWRRAHATLYAQDRSFRTLADGIALFTQGDYAVVNAMAVQATTGALPERFKDSALPTWHDKPYFGNPLSQYKEFFPGQAKLDDHDPSRATWSELSHTLLDAIASAPPLTEPIYRGMHGREVFTTMAALKVNDEIDIAGVASFTFDKLLAEQFASGTAPGQRRGKDAPFKVHLTVQAGARGIPVAALSPWNQQEVMASGRFRVVSTVESPGAYLGYGGRGKIVEIVLRQVKTWTART